MFRKPGVLLFLFLLIGCADSVVLYKIQIDGHTLQVEIADTDEERQLGLMHRKSMDPDRGMLFIFDNSRVRSFWMKDTLIPLSIAYIDDKGVILDIKDMQPLDTSPVKSSGPARYALELNQGRFKELGITAGDTLILPENIH